MTWWTWVLNLPFERSQWVIQTLRLQTSWNYTDKLMQRYAKLQKFHRGGHCVVAFPTTPTRERHPKEKESSQCNMLLSGFPWVGMSWRWPSCCADGFLQCHGSSHSSGASMGALDCLRAFEAFFIRCNCLLSSWDNMRQHKKQLWVFVEPLWM